MTLITMPEAVAVFTTGALLMLSGYALGRLTRD